MTQQWQNDSTQTCIKVDVHLSYNAPLDKISDPNALSYFAALVKYVATIHYVSSINLWFLKELVQLIMLFWVQTEFDLKKNCQ